MNELSNDLHQYSLEVENKDGSRLNSNIICKLLMAIKMYTNIQQIVANIFQLKYSNYWSETILVDDKYFAFIQLNGHSFSK